MTFATSFAASVTVAVGMIIESCARPPTSITLSPVGPEPRLSPESRNGVLIVYSEMERITPPFDEFENRRSAFEITNANRERMTHVAGAQYGAQPARISLAPGHYVVTASMREFGSVQVPVVIAANETTDVRLDGSEPANANNTAAAKPVRLPNGAFVGWASFDAASASTLEAIGMSSTVR